ncbi:MAG: hypothetical protein AAFQ87_26465 [Bacteroidota bacterium]
MKSLPYIIFVFSLTFAASLNARNFYFKTVKQELLQADSVLQQSTEPYVVWLDGSKEEEDLWKFSYISKSAKYDEAPAYPVSGLCRSI